MLWCVTMEGVVNQKTLTLNENINYVMEQCYIILQGRMGRGEKPL